MASLVALADGPHLLLPVLVVMDATDEVRVVVFHREHFIVRLDWIF